MLISPPACCPIPAHDRASTHLEDRLINNTAVQKEGSALLSSLSSTVALADQQHDPEHFVVYVWNMQTCYLQASHHVASMPCQRCKRGVSLLCYSTRIEAGPGRAGRSLEAVLSDVGIEASVLGSVRQVSTSSAVLSGTGGGWSACNILLPLMPAWRRSYISPRFISPL
jgi:hypothetical protein